MSDPDRGAYTPQNDAPLSFDARQTRGGGSRPPTTLIISAIILVVIAAAVVFVYRNGFRTPAEPPQPVGKPIGDMKTPAPADQKSDPAAGLDIYKSGDPKAAPAAPTFAPGPEQPAPRPVPRPTLQIQTGELPAAGGRSDAHPAPPAKPAAAAPEVAASGDTSRSPVAAKIKPATPAAAPVAAAPVVATATKPAATGPAAVQIGAFSSEAQASKGLGDLASAYPNGGKGKRIEPVASNGGTLYRGIFTGFASREDAAAYCAKLKAGGKSCIVR